MTKPETNSKSKPKSKTKQKGPASTQRSPKRQETYDDLKQDMLEFHGEDLWRVMDSYIHSPLVTTKLKEQKTKPKRKSKAKTGSGPKHLVTIRQLMRDIDG